MGLISAQLVTQPVAYVQVLVPQTAQNASCLTFFNLASEMPLLSGVRRLAQLAIMVMRNPKTVRPVIMVVRNARVHHTGSAQQDVTADITNNQMKVEQYDRSHVLPDGLNTIVRQSVLLTVAIDVYIVKLKQTRHEQMAVQLVTTTTHWTGLLDA